MTRIIAPKNNAEPVTFTLNLLYSQAHIEHDRASWRRGASKARKTLKKIEAGSKNVRFDEFARLLEAFGFKFQRIRGSHHVFTHPLTVDPFPVQPGPEGKAIPYQMREFTKLVERHTLKMSDETDESGS